MVFTLLFNCLLILVCLVINLEFNTSIQWIFEQLGGYFPRDQYHLLLEAPEHLQKTFCAEYVGQLDREYAMSNVLYFLLIFNVIGTTSSIFQRVAIVKVKDNVEMNPMILVLELSFIFVGITYGQLFNITEYNTITSEVCGKFQQFTPEYY